MSAPWIGVYRCTGLIGVDGAKVIAAAVDDLDLEGARPLVRAMNEHCPRMLIRDRENLISYTVARFRQADHIESGIERTTYAFNRWEEEVEQLRDDAMADLAFAVRKYGRLAVAS